MAEMGESVFCTREETLIELALALIPLSGQEWVEVITLGDDYSISMKLNKYTKCNCWSSPTYDSSYHL
jgi:hypothetical protein